MPSSETETCSRGRSALDRDGASLEGASSPRARQNPARGGDRPSSEAEPHPRGRGCTGAAPCPSSEAEFRPRVARPIVSWAVALWVYLARVLGLVCVCFLRT
jgi:hypothetical protein